ncbi:MAG: hypothetical protein H6Q73_2561 [Firmicutes bacterium]|nr:hypothetical protein [Bacillota bacterium]
MPIVDCRLTDCKYRGIEICTARHVSIDGYGQVECYEPVPRSAVVHEPVDSRCYKQGGKWKASRVKIIK